MSHVDHGVVVVGAGLAACQLAVELRQAGHSGPITLIGDEAHPPYNRPPLSKEFLTGPVDFELLAVRGPAFFADHDIGLALGDPATTVDRDRREVSFASGATPLPYSTLVFATGARNRQIPLTRADSPTVLGLRDYEDGLALRERLDAGGSVVIIGAGFIGMEIAAVARTRGLEVTVVEVAPRAMARALSAPMAEHMTGHLAESGIRFCFDARPKSLVREGNTTRLELEDGAAIEASFALVAAGILPNSAVAEASGLETGNGIVVDEFLRTSDPSIYAIGDCAFFPSAELGESVRLESVQNASDQARTLASTIMGRPAPYAKVPWFWSHQGDMSLQIAGLSLGADSTIVVGDSAGEKFSVYLFAGERLIAVESLNATGEHAAARRVLASGPRPSRAQVDAHGFDLRQFTRSRET